MKSIIRRFRNKYYRLKRKNMLKIDSNNFNLQIYGNQYGGFNICTDFLGAKELIVYSFGIGEDLSFSEAIMNVYKAQIFAFDPTPKAINYVHEHKLNLNPNFHFQPIGLSDRDEITQFYLPIKDDYVSGSVIAHDSVKKVGIDVKMRCLNTIVNYYGHSRIDILKMDIEGSEFTVIEDIRNCCVPIEQICVEIHDRFFEDGLDKLQVFLGHLRQMGYILISVSEGEQELTFIKQK